MNFFITKKMLVAVILLLCGILIAIWLTGCGHGTAGLRPPGTGTPGVHGGPASALAGLAVWATWAAGVGLLLCGVAAALPIFPNKLAIAKVALGCLAGLITAGMLHWISAHWAVLLGLCAGVLVLSGVAWAYINRKALERRSGVDLNRDGRIG